MKILKRSKILRALEGFSFKEVYNSRPFQCKYCQTVHTAFKAKRVGMKEGGSTTFFVATKELKANANTKFRFLPLFRERKRVTRGLDFLHTHRARER